MNTLKALWAIVSGIFFIVTSVALFVTVGTMLHLPTWVSLVLWLSVPLYGVVFAVNADRDRRLSLLHDASVSAAAEAEAAWKAHEDAALELTALENVRDSVVGKPLWASLSLRSS